MIELGRRSLVAGAVVGVCLPRWSRAAEWTLRYGGNLPVAHPLSRRIAEAAEAIAQETDGRLRIECFPDNQLGGDSAMLADVSSGALDFMTVSGLILSRLVPAAAINGIGYAFSSYGIVWSAMDGSLGGLVRDAIEQAGLHAMPRMFDNGYRQVTSATRPIAHPDDFRGMRLRVPVGQLWSSLFDAFGADPVALDFVHAYDALQSHSLDGQENALGLISAAKLYEVQRYCSMTNHMWDGFWFIANEAKWASLPGSLQAVVARHMDDAATVQRAEVRALNDSVADDLQERGMVFNRPDPVPFRDALQKTGFYREWATRLGPMAWGLLESTAGPLD